MCENYYIYCLQKIRGYIDAEKDVNFSRFLFFNWFIMPIITAALTTMVGVLTKVEDSTKRFTASVPYEMFIMLTIADAFYIIHIILQIFEVSYFFGFIAITIKIAHL